MESRHQRKRSSSLQDSVRQVDKGKEKSVSELQPDFKKSDTLKGIKKPDDKSVDSRLDSLSLESPRDSLKARSSSSPCSRSAADFNSSYSSDISSGSKLTNNRRGSASPRIFSIFTKKRSTSDSVPSIQLESIRSIRTPRSSKTPRTPRTPRSPRLTPRTPSPRLKFYSNNLPITPREVDEILTPYLDDVVKLKKEEGSCFRYAAENGKKYDIFFIGDKAIGRIFYLLDKSDLLGYGGSAKVYKAYNLQTGELLAAKIFNPGASYKILAAERRNLLICNRFSGEAKINNGKQHIMFKPFIPGVDLPNFLYDTDSSKTKEDIGYFFEKKHLSFNTRLALVLFVLENLHEWHEKFKLIHCDVKTDSFRVNIEKDRIRTWLFDEDGCVMISNTSARTYHSTFGFAPPEICQHSKSDLKFSYSRQADYYSIGVVIADIISDRNYLNFLNKKMTECAKKNVLKDLPHKEVMAFFKKTISHPHKEKKGIDMQTDEGVDQFTASHLGLEAELARLVKSLTRKDPQKRLSNSSLKNEINKLRALKKSFTMLSNALTKRRDATLELENFGLEESDLQEESSLPAPKI